MTGASRQYTGPGGRAASTTAAGGGDNAGGDNGNRAGNGRGGNGRGGKPDVPPGQSGEHGQGSGGGSANGNGNGKGNGQGQGPGRGQALGHQKLRPVTQETRYLYDGLTWNVVKEYAGQGNAPLAQYYYANGRVIARKLFGLKGLVIPGREPHLQANGNLLYYHYDAQGNPALLTDPQGEVAEEYRYDAFGGLYTGLTAPYNTVGLTGKTYDPKAGLLDFATRWYDPALGRFMTPDVYRGTLQNPLTQHLNAYGGNNPVTRVDPLGMLWETGRRYGRRR